MTKHASASVTLLALSVLIGGCGSKDDGPDPSIPVVQGSPSKLHHAEGAGGASNSAVAAQPSLNAPPH